MRLIVACGVALLGSCGVPDFEFNAGTGGSDSGLGGKDGGKGASGGTSDAGGTGAGGTGLGGASGGAGIGGQANDAGTSCTDSTQCAPPKPFCDAASGKCAACLPSDDQCPAGQYCAPSLVCGLGCKSDADCNPGGVGPLTCSTTHECKGCTLDAQCVAGKICDLGSTECVPGCTALHPCASNYDCCNGTCALLSVDVANCGNCGNACPTPPSAKPDCVAGKCGLKCDFGKADCNKLPADGCEIDVQTDSQNCGTCGKICGPSQSCTNFTCA